jgi:hypothetical protein
MAIFFLESLKLCQSHAFLPAQSLDAACFLVVCMAAAPQSGHSFSITFYRCIQYAQNEQRVYAVAGWCCAEQTLQLAFTV